MTWTRSRHPNTLRVAAAASLLRTSGDLSGLKGRSFSLPPSNLPPPFHVLPQGPDTLAPMPPVPAACGGTSPRQRTDRHALGAPRGIRRRPLSGPDRGAEQGGACPGNSLSPRRNPIMNPTPPASLVQPLTPQPHDIFH